MARLFCIVAVITCLLLVIGFGTFASDEARRSDSELARAWALLETS